ncbi:hypothetical protein E2562_031423 [Oryza meyeriana var. granulata]|uniref:Uncharacterized protein n=1 Tax=Oryza meyeriana var. granulata TaxID=110450 RepID=A0A6G1C0E1_9ORYZ|nr:hypothetical protein E2562_031423 [Oryza meyeriana var. granulata]
MAALLPSGGEAKADDGKQSKLDPLRRCKRIGGGVDEEMSSAEAVSSFQIRQLQPLAAMAAVDLGTITLRLISSIWVPSMPPTFSTVTATSFLR